jgi:hypothetical protein
MTFTTCREIVLVAVRLVNSIQYCSYIFIATGDFSLDALTMAILTTFSIGTLLANL